MGAAEDLAEPSGRSAPEAALSLQAPHLPGARSSWRFLLADKAAKCSAQVLHGSRGRAEREQKRDRGYGFGAVPCLLRSVYSTGPFSSGAQEEGLDDIDAKSGLEFSLARIKGFIGALL